MAIASAVRSAALRLRAALPFHACRSPARSCVFAHLGPIIHGSIGVALVQWLWTPLRALV
jgi:hypothetical protein